jgi:hypothetical protein
MLSGLYGSVEPVFPLTFPKSLWAFRELAPRRPPMSSLIDFLGFCFLICLDCVLGCTLDAPASFVVFDGPTGAPGA